MPYIHGSCGNIPGSSGIYNKKHPKQSYCKNIWMDSFCYLNTRAWIQSSFLFLQHPCVVYNYLLIDPIQINHENVGKFIPKSSHGVAHDHKIHKKTRVFQLLAPGTCWWFRNPAGNHHLAYIKSNRVTNGINYIMYLPTKKQDNVCLGGTWHVIFFFFGGGTSWTFVFFLFSPVFLDVFWSKRTCTSKRRKRSWTRPNLFWKLGPLETWVVTHEFGSRGFSPNPWDIMGRSYIAYIAR